MLLYFIIAILYALGAWVSFCFLLDQDGPEYFWESAVSAAFWPFIATYATIIGIIEHVQNGK